MTPKGLANTLAALANLPAVSSRLPAPAWERLQTVSEELIPKMSLEESR
eukprot:CAMPEP_0181386706 /NCGR_PEP_ID=MMETSP1106-20121128/23294_1 /TAXON_ID=81844 /ORGANISM="Mantoniella antarctica, Strain SL-175" /LENGTH=48 /DNA_ID= /DNA_START= /DNA_END= /DNA_ORIENTATION=